MVSKKLLIGGGVATVGSVATAVVVASQNRAPSVSTSEATDSPVEGQIRTDTDPAETSEEADEELQEETSREKEIEQSREDVRNWLKKNGGSNDWQVQIRKNDEYKKLTEIDPWKLSNYLEEKTELLTSLASEQTTFTFIFENDGGDDWKIMPTTEQITKWVEKTSNGKAALKIAIESEREELKDIDVNDNLNKLFEGLFNNKKVFEDLKETKNTKNILFEQMKKNKYVDEGGWVHSKTEIEKWLKTDDKKSNRFEMKIKKGDDGETKKFDEIDEEDLIGLFDYLVKEENSSLPYGSTEETISLIFKMEKNDGGNSWNFVYKGEDAQDTDQIT